MIGLRKLDLVAIVFFLLFSEWFLSETYKFDGKTNFYWAAHHQVSDLGFHFGIARNFPDVSCDEGIPLGYLDDSCTVFKL